MKRTDLIIKNYNNENKTDITENAQPQQVSKVCFICLAVCCFWSIVGYWDAFILDYKTTGSIKSFIYGELPYIKRNDN